MVRPSSCDTGDHGPHHTGHSRHKRHSEGQGGRQMGEVLLPLLGGVERENTWQDQALCAETDPEAFFPEKGGSTREAKKVCLSCSVRDDCLEYALGHDERFGIWGGLSERERRRLKKRAV